MSSKPCLDCSGCPTPCKIYDSSGTTWPRQAFPATAFLNRYTSSSLREARAAWELFERVEAHDAAIRVCYSGIPGWSPSPTAPLWYRFANSSERTAYLYGRQLHIALCPGFVWTSQRNLEIPAAAKLTDVYPACCS